VEIGRQVRLLCTWARYLTGDSLTRRPKRSHRCLLVDVPWQINEYLPTYFKPHKQIFFIQIVANHRPVVFTTIGNERDIKKTGRDIKNITVEKNLHSIPIRQIKSSQVYSQWNTQVRYSEKTNWSSRSTIPKINITAKVNLASRYARIDVK